MDDGNDMRINASIHTSFVRRDDLTIFIDVCCDDAMDTNMLLCMYVALAGMEMNEWMDW
jgi:hypothetical protein